MTGPSPVIFVLLGLVVVILLVLVTVSWRRARKERAGAGAKKKTNKNRDQILKDANKRLAQNPKDAQALSILADVYFNDGQWDKSMTTYAALIETATSNPVVDEFEAHMRHGISALNLKKYEEAYHSLSMARTLKPDVFEINYNLGVIEYNRKQFEKAAVLLNSAVQAHPDHLEARKYLGMSLFRAKHYREAIDKLKSVIDERMDEKEAIYYLAYSYFENGQMDMAGQLFSHLRPDPLFGPQASLMAGSIHLKSKQYDDAQLDFEIGLKHKGTKREVLLELEYRLATALMRKQEIAEALIHLNTIYELDPNYKDVAAQIQNSAELTKNEYLQTYLIGAPSDFVSLCRRLSGTFFHQARTKVVDIFVDKGDYADIMAEVETPAWEDIILFRFIRSTGQVGELTLRDLYTKSKDMKAGRAFCVTAGKFSETAVKFVEARSIDLVEKEGLVKSINKLQHQVE